MILSPEFSTNNEFHVMPYEALGIYDLRVSC